MYDNYENLKICQDGWYGCRYEANPCCRYAKNLKREKACGNFDCLYWNSDYWSWQKPGLLRFAFFMFLQFLAHIVILLLIETSFIKKFNCKKPKKSLKFECLEKESDVECEENRIKKTISNLNSSTDTLIIHDLCKSYSDFLAVKRISFGVKTHECFGLLGLFFYYF